MKETYIKDMEFLIRELHKEWGRSKSERKSVALSLNDAEVLRKKIAESIEKQQIVIAKQKELMEDIKNAIDELINGIQYEDEYYTQILDKMVINDKNHIDVYLKMLPHKWSFTVAKGVTGALETLKKAEASANTISEASLPISVSNPLTSP